MRMLIMLAVLMAPVTALAGPPFQDLTTTAPRTAQDELDRLAYARFQPISEAASAGRTLRRVTFRDSYGVSARPAVLIEKLANGDVVMTLTANDGRINETRTIAEADWQALIAEDAKIMAPPKARPTAAEARRLCYSNSVVIEAVDAGKVRRRDASHCGKDTEAMLYGYKVAEIAVRNTERCLDFAAPDREFSWVLAECTLEGSGPQARQSYTAGR